MYFIPSLRESLSPLYAVRAADGTGALRRARCVASIHRHVQPGAIAAAVLCSRQSWRTICRWISLWCPFLEVNYGYNMLYNVILCFFNCSVFVNLHFLLENCYDMLWRPSWSYFKWNTCETPCSTVVRWCAVIHTPVGTPKIQFITFHTNYSLSRLSHSQDFSGFIACVDLSELRLLQPWCTSSRSERIQHARHVLATDSNPDPSEWDEWLAKPKRVKTCTEQWNCNCSSNM